MALQINLPDTGIGLPAPEAYARIVMFSYDVFANKVSVGVNVYANAQARHDGKNPVGGGVFEGIVGEDFPTLDAELTTGVRSAIYNWLKTQPTFAGAIDV